MSAIIPATAQDCLTLAKTVWGEARGEDYIGQVQVAHVVINRLKSGRWFGGKSITEVCLKPYQFSCWNEDDPNRAKMDSLALDNAAFQLAMLVALQVIQGLSIPCGDGTETHYYRTGTPVPKWAVGKQRSFAVGAHEFFSNIN